MKMSILIANLARRFLNLDLHNKPFLNQHLKLKAAIALTIKPSSF
jgi:hypothetical protein